MTALDILRERGFVQQVSHDEKLNNLLATERITVYAGYDPTADSLTVGHLVPTMALANLQRAGHRVIALIGTGTTMVADPTGKTELRPMLDREAIQSNSVRIKAQLGRILDFTSPERGLCLDNGDWLLQLNYVDFLREVGTQLSVNRMVSAECVRGRMEREDGLTAFEFGYMPLQAYDFLELHRKYGCRLQIGGDDQWSNILAGVDLIRRLERTDAFALTLRLLMTADGRKMGKSEAGAVRLDPQRTSPADFYRYWDSTADADVGRCLTTFTFLPMDEVHRLGAAEGHAMTESKRKLAFEVTKLVHGEEEAHRAQALA